MKEILKDIKERFRKGDILTRLIYVNSGLFIASVLFSIIWGLITCENYESASSIFAWWLALPVNDLEGFLIKPYTIVTSIFLHIEFFHLFWNMLLMYFLGRIFLNYFDSNGYFKLFDTGNMINNNYYVHGRIDDVLNIRGHRIGSGEIESVILSIKDIKEASVIDTENSITGKSISVFVSLKKKINHKEILKSKINSKIINIFGKFALPDKIIFVKDLPKTKSGKILRRLLRSIYLNKKPSSYGDLSTILDPSCIKDIKSAIRQKK